MSYFCAVLFPIDLVIKRAIRVGGQRSVFLSFLADFSPRQDSLLEDDYHVTGGGMTRCLNVNNAVP